MALVPAGTNWTDAESDLLVADYFAMLGDELAGRPYMKSHHNAGIATSTHSAQRQPDRTVTIGVVRR